MIWTPSQRDTCKITFHYIRSLLNPTTETYNTGIKKNTVDANIKQFSNFPKQNIVPIPFPTALFCSWSTIILRKRTPQNKFVLLAIFRPNNSVLKGGKRFYSSQQRLNYYAVADSQELSVKICVQFVTDAFNKINNSFLYARPQMLLIHLTTASFPLLLIVFLLWMCT